MPFDCPSLCFETTFLVALSRYNLTKGAHSSSENPLQSFVACFSTLLPGEDVANRASLLYRSITEGMDGANSYYASGIELEYGIHAHLLTEASCPNAALLSAFSRIFNMEIYVVCGNLPLRFLRIEGNNGEYDVVKFNFCRSESPRRVVIGLIGMGVYHLIKQPANDSHLWQALGRRAIIVNESVILIVCSGERVRVQGVPGHSCATPVQLTLPPQSSPADDEFAKRSHRCQAVRKGRNKSASFNNND